MPRSPVPADGLEDLLDELKDELQHAIDAFEVGAQGDLPRALLAVNRAAFHLALAAETAPEGEAPGWAGGRRGPVALCASIAAAAASLASLALGHHRHLAPATASKLS